MAWRQAKRQLAAVKGLASTRFIARLTVFTGDERVNASLGKKCGGVEG